MEILTSRRREIASRLFLLEACIPNHFDRGLSLGLDRLLVRLERLSQAEKGDDNRARVLHG